MANLNIKSQTSPPYLVRNTANSKSSMEIRVGQSWRVRTTTVGAVALISAGMVSGFANPSLHPFGMPRSAVSSVSCPVSSVMSQLIKARNKPKRSTLFMANDRFQKLDEDDDNVISFIDMSSDGEKAIDCYVDSVATVDGVEYTIGSPCDYAVALCYFDEDDQLVPIELDDPLMDDIFPVAEGIIEDEFGEELVLLRTPQTLTLIGELEESETDDDEDVDDDEDGEVGDTEEEVEILVSFEEDGQEYHLVRLLDPILLVGKDGNEMTRILLTPEESDSVMPKLEEMFLSYQEERDGM